MAGTQQHGAAPQRGGEGSAGGLTLPMQWRPTCGLTCFLMYYECVATQVCALLR